MSCAPPEKLGEWELRPRRCGPRAAGRAAADLVGHLKPEAPTCTGGYEGEDLTDVGRRPDIPFHEKHGAVRACRDAHSHGLHTSRVNRPRPDGAFFYSALTGRRENDHVWPDADGAEQDAPSCQRTRACERAALRPVPASANPRSRLPQLTSGAASSYPCASSSSDLRRGSAHRSRAAPSFYDTANERRSETELSTWWMRPYAVTQPDGRLDVRCLDGGAWDRPTFYGTVSSVDADRNRLQTESNPTVAPSSRSPR